jgi:hypothetical protein
MNLERLEALLWERIDGVIGAEDRTELEAFLAQDQEARELEHELGVLADRLASARELKPPAELRERIDRALIMAEPPLAPAEAVEVPGPRAVAKETTAVEIPAAPAAKPPPTPPKAAARPRTDGGWQSRLLPLAASLLIGVAIGFLVQFAAGPGVDASRAVGTMHVPAEPAPTDVVTIDLAGDLGALSVWREGPLLAAELGLVEDIEVELVLESSFGDLFVGGAGMAESPASEISLDGGRVVLRAVGAGRYALKVVAAEKRVPIRLRVNSGVEVLADRWIESVEEQIEP